MMFVRVNDHMIKCTIRENEIIEMGYQIEDICKNQEIASEFVKHVINKGNESGFDIPEDIHAVQATFLPNRILILCFMDQVSELQMNEAIEQLLENLDVMKTIEKEGLEEILSLSEQESVIEEYIEEFAPTGELPKEQLEDTEEDENEPVTEKEKSEKYILTFHDFNITESFCKKSPSIVPGMLYKSNGNFFLLTDLSTLEEKERKNFLLLASEYSDEIQKDYLTSDYLEEHADVMIAHEPIQILKFL